MRSAKPASKRQRQRFATQVKKLLLSLGAEKTGDKLVLQTRVGLLLLNLTERPSGGLGTVVAYFGNPGAARRLVACDPDTGEWNHEYQQDWTAEDAVADLARWLRRVL